MAAEWFLKAAEYGKGYGGLVAPAQCALAVMYAAGLGVEKDEKQSDFWLARPNTHTHQICRDMALVRFGTKGTH